MPVLSYLLAWWLLSSIIVFIVVRLPYSMFLECKIITSIIGFFLGPMAWVIVIFYWFRFGISKLHHHKDREYVK